MSRQTLIQQLPDIPRWVETRAMLLSGRGEILHFDQEPVLSAVVFQADIAIGTVIGRPPTDWIQSLATSADEILVTPEDADGVMATLPGWQRSDCVLYELPDFARLEDADAPGSRLLEDGELDELHHVPKELAKELRLEIAGGAPVAVSCEGDLPVSICCAWSITETLFDIGIDTLDGYRRKGHARRSASQLIRVMADRDRRPVWGADRTNEGSMRLAESLGFRQLDELVVLSDPDG